METLPLERLEILEASLEGPLQTVESFGEEIRALPPEHIERVKQGLQRLTQRHRTTTIQLFNLTILAELLGDDQLLKSAAIELLRREPEHLELLVRLDEAQVSAWGETAHRLRAVDEQIVRLTELGASTDFESAIARMRSLVLENPDHARAILAYTRMCSECGDSIAALEVIRALREKGFEHTFLLVNEAKLLFELGEMEQAAQACINSLIVTPRFEEALHIAIKIGRQEPRLVPRLSALANAAREKAVDTNVVDTLLSHLGAEVTSARRPTPQIDRLISTARKLELQGETSNAARTYQQWATAAHTLAAYLEAGAATERLGSLGSAEFCYNQAKTFQKHNPAANEGLERVRRARGLQTSSVAEEADYRHLAERKLQTGDFASALSLYMRWAEKQGTAQAFFEAGQFCEKANQTGFALPLYQRAQSLSAAHPEAIAALERLSNGALKSPSQVLQDIKQCFDLQTHKAALNLASELVDGETAPDIMLRLALLLRRYRIATFPEQWRSNQNANAKLLSGLLQQGQMTYEQVFDSEDVLSRKLAGRMALAERRWRDAKNLLQSSGGPELAVASYFCGELNAALSLFPKTLEVCAEFLKGLTFPDVRRISTTTAIVMRDAADRAWDSYQSGDLENAVFLYALAGQSNDPGGLLARFNAANIWLRLQQAEKAEPLLRDLRTRMGGDVPVIWLHAVCALRLGFEEDASNILNALLDRDPLNKQARQLAVVLAIRAHRSKEALELISFSPPPHLDLHTSTLLIGIAQELGDDHLLEDTFARLADSFTMNDMLAQTKSSVPPQSPPLNAGRATRAEVINSGNTHMTGNQSRQVAVRPDGQRQAPPPVPYNAFKSRIENMRKEGRIAEAQAELEHYVSRSPNNIPARLLLAQVLIQRGSDDRAEIALTKALDIAKTCRDIEQTVSTLGEILRFLTSRGRTSGAAEILMDMDDEVFEAGRPLMAIVERLDRDDHEGLGHFAASRYFRVRGNSARATESLRQAILARPGDERIRRDCQTLAPHLLKEADFQLERLQKDWSKLNRRGQPLRGLELIQVHRRRTPSHPGLKRMEAVALEALGQDEDAFTLRQELVQAHSLREDRLALALLAARLGRESIELDQYGSILTHDPFDPDVHRRLQHIHRMDLLPCPIEDSELLRLCSQIVTERNRDAQGRLLERLVNGPRPSNASHIIQVLTNRLPADESWKEFVLKFTMAQQSSVADTATIHIRSKASTPPNVSHTHEGKSSASARDNPNQIRLAEQARARWATWDQMLKLNPGADAWEKAMDLIISAPKLRPIVDMQRNCPTNKRYDRLVEMIHQGLEDLERVDGPARILMIINILWLFRFRHHSVRYESNLDDRDSRYRAIGESIQSELLPSAFRTLTEFPVSTGLIYGHEVVEVALQSLPSLMKELKTTLNSLRNMAESFLQIEESDNVRERGIRAQQAYAFSDRISKQTFRHTPLETTRSLKTLLAHWREFLDAYSAEIDHVARLEVQLGSILPLSAYGSFIFILKLHNRGNAAARDLQLRFARTQGSTTNSGSLTVANGDLASELSPGQSRMVSIKVDDVQVDCRALSVDLSVTYLANPQSLRDDRVFEEVLIPPWIEHRNVECGNPYRIGLPLSPEDASFVERSELLNRIRKSLGHGQERNVVLLHGLRRVGKTTLLKNLLKSPPQGDIPVIVNLEALAPEEYRTAGVLVRIAQWINGELSSKGFTPPLIVNEQWQQTPFDCFYNFLETLRTQIGQRRLLLMLDEFEVLLDKIGRGHLDAGLLGAMRHLMQHETCLAFVLVGANRVLEMTRNYNTSFFNMVDPFQVAFLTREEAEMLIQRPLLGQISYAREAVDMLVYETSGHPFLLQLLCSQIFDRLEGRDHIIQLDVRKVIKPSVEQTRTAEIFLAMFEKPMLNPVERLVLATLADLTERDRYCASERLSSKLSELGHSISESELFSRFIVKLDSLDLARYQRRPDGHFDFCVSIPLFAKWLRQHRSPENLVEEVLAETLASTSQDPLTAAPAGEKP